jgi:hypothetical protein
MRTLRKTPNIKNQTPNKHQAPNTNGLTFSIDTYAAMGCLRFGIYLVFGFWCLVFCPAAAAHIGDQNVFFEGHAGPYPVRVVVRPPGVIPGLAEISVRVETNGAQRVTVLPVRWNTGRQGAPPPDTARPVRGETNLFSGELWFMRDGAQSVEVEVTGMAGSGKVIVPVNAVATRVLGMPRGLGRLLAALGVLLVLLAASIVGAAVRSRKRGASRRDRFEKTPLVRTRTHRGGHGSDCRSALVRQQVVAIGGWRLHEQSPLSTGPNHGQCSGRQPPSHFDH